MENSETPVAIGFTIRHPDRLLAGIWLGAGFLLILSFFLPNYEMAGMKIGGPKIIEMVWRRDSLASRIFDDAGFMMMVAVPIAYVMQGMLSLGLGVLGLFKLRHNIVLGVAIAGFMAFIFTIIGAVVIDNANTDVPFFSKLVPKPTFVYWLAMGLQLVICLASVGYLILKRPQAAIGQADS